MPLDTWLSFFVASWLISLSPGPGAVSCMAAGSRYGFRRAMWNLAGLQLGVVTLVMVVAAGLGAVLNASHYAFMVIKWAGVAYLIWLGIAQWRAVPKALVASDALPQGRWAIVWRAYLINVSNPKGIVFMVAVLPHFIDAYAPQWPQYLACLATLLFTDIVVMCGYTLLAARVLAALRDPHHQRWIGRTFGSLFVGAGALLAGFQR